MIPIAIDKESLEAVRGFGKHNELLGEAKDLTTRARDKLLQIRESFLEEIHKIGAGMVDDAIKHLEVNISKIEAHQVASKEGEAKCLDAMQITSLSEVCAQPFRCFKP